MARIIDAFTQFFNDNGDPLVDGFLKFVESGTNNTDKDTFADVNETIPNANPVPLDGAGRCPNVFGTGAYNVISYTNAMVQIQQFDPVSADTLLGNFSNWNSTTIYDEGDIVVGSDGLYYRSITADNQNQNPVSSPGQWEQFKVIGIWNTNITYTNGDSVYGSDGFLYTSRTVSNLGNDPISDTTNWRPGAEIQFTKGADIASATALPLGADGNYFDITGTTAITSIDPVGVGAIVKLHFDDVLTLTYNATDLILPSGADITTAAGDEAEFFEYASGDWRCVSYMTASGRALIEEFFIGSIPAAPGLFYLGSGDDGAKTVSTSEDLASGEYHYTSLTIDSGQTLGVSESSDGWLILRVTGTCTIVGTINLDGKGAAGGASQSTASTDGNTGSSGSGGGTGGGGGSSDSTQKGGAGGVSTIRGISIAGGAQSPNGPNGAGGDGVATSARLTSIIQSQVAGELYSINASGGGSGGYRTGTGSGKGGNGGGGLLIIASTIDFQTGANITCDGTDGDAGTDSINGSGGGGGGGTVVLASRIITNDGTITVTGGSPGADSGNGGVGGTGGDGYSTIITAN